MDWANERYVRLYTRDTADDLVLSWQASGLWPLLVRKADRAGVIATSHGIRGIAALIRWPLDVVAGSMPELLADGRIRSHPLGFVIPNFIEAQEATSEGAERQRKHREKRRDMINAGLLPDQRCPVVYFVQSEHGGPIKIGHAEDIGKRLVQLQVSRPDKLVVLATIPGSVGEEGALHRRFANLRERGEWFTDGADLVDFVRDLSQSVTSNNTLPVTPQTCLLPVTPSLPSRSDPCRTVPNQEREMGSAPVTPPAAPVSRAKGTKGKPTDHTDAELASVRVVLDRLSERSGVKYQGSKEHTRLIVSRLRDGVTEWDLRRVIGYCADRLGWQDNPAMRPFLRPETLFGPQTLQKYLDPARTWAPGSEPTDEPIASGEAAESAGPKLRLVQEADERPDQYARQNDGGLFDFSNDQEQEPEWMTK